MTRVRLHRADSRLLARDIDPSPQVEVMSERSFSRSLSATSPPVKPSTIENGPVMSRLA